jgi:hypothetical protein
MNQEEIFLKKINIIKKYSSSLNNVDKICLECLENEFYLAINNFEFDVVIVKYKLLDRLNSLSHKLSENAQYEYKRYNLVKPMQERAIICPNCKLSLITYDMELICDVCGYNEPINCMVFDDFMHKRLNKKKDYSAPGFCEKWLDLVQGKCLIDIPEEIQNKLIYEIQRKCSIGGIIMPKLLNQITCVDIRNWLRIYKYTKYNKFTSYIIRTLTKKIGHEILPPQFTIEEEQLILSDFKYLSVIYCNEYNKMKQKNTNKKNNSYYPLFIYFIAKERWPYKVRELDQFIYKQSLNTYNLRLICWEHTIKITNYKFL